MSLDRSVIRIAELEAECAKLRALASRRDRQRKRLREALQELRDAGRWAIDRRDEQRNARLIVAKANADAALAEDANEND